MLADTISRNADWHDEKSFWNDVVAKSPHKARAYLGLARAYMSDDPARTRAALERGLELDPSSAELQDNYGIALMAAQQPAEALKHFERAMELTHPSADHFNNIGAAYFNMNEFDQSRDSYRRALELDACSYNARRNLVMVLSRTDPEAAYRTGEVPASCHLIPSQAAELEQYRRQVIRQAGKKL
jgi:Tfp pilus assembly protein PilF